MTFRKLLFWTHLVCGVAAATAILIMSVTGVLLTYQRQITAWADMRAYDGGPPSPDAARLPVDTLAAGVPGASSGEAQMTVTVRSDPNAPASIVAGQKTFFVNAYTGAVLGEGAPGIRAFFRRVTDWHRWLAASAENRATGRMITGISNLAFFIIVLSGPILWWPKKFTLKQIRAITWFKGGLPSKARDFNWHNTIGFWSAIPLIVVVGSGVVISYPWASNLVYRAAGEQPPAQGARGGPVQAARGGAAQGARPAGAAERPAGPAGRAAGQRAGDVRQETTATAGVVGDVLVARAAAQSPAWRTIAVRLPLPSQGQVAVTVDEGDGGQPQKRGTLTLDAATGNIVKWESQAAATPGRRARSWLRFAHTGEVYGLAGQTIAGLASLGGVVLVWTGLALSYRRFLNWRVVKKREAERRAAAPVGALAARQSTSLP
ncbi:MAG: PepSY domain-containing protein [Acidobacteria bacterium]|nr:PepSY domain-containing protein [Acidobacteriota bacterium]